MIDLTDFGYTDYRMNLLDPGGAAEGSLGGPSDIIQRPGIRYAVQYTLPALRSADDARQLQMQLEQGARDDVSYPWPLDIAPGVAGTPVVNGSTAPGNSIPIRGLLPNFQFRIGQPIAVVLADGSGFVHRATAATIANSSGQATVPVFPLTRTTFADASTVEIERPRIRGILSWEGAAQGSFGARPFSFSIAERR